MRNLPAWARIALVVIGVPAALLLVLALLQFVVAPLAVWAFVQFVRLAVVVGILELMLYLVVSAFSKDAAGHLFRAQGQLIAAVVVAGLKPLGYKPPEKDKKKKKT